MVYYKLVYIIINIAKIIINIVIKNLNLVDFIVNNQKLGFTSKFWTLLCYLLGIKLKLSITFYIQIST